MDKFNPSIIEKDIERLNKEIIEKRNLPEYKKVPEKELVRQALQPLIKQQVNYPIQTQKQPIIRSEDKILPDYLKDSPVELKLHVEKLLNLVFHQGIKKTVKEASRAGAFVLDALHDALTDKLYEELKNRGLIE